MSEQPSLYKMIEAVLKLDDTYKIFLLSTLYAIFLYSILFIGIDITPEGIYTLTINTFITALANMIRYHLVRLVLDGLGLLVFMGNSKQVLFLSQACPVSEHCPCCRQAMYGR